MNFTKKNLVKLSRNARAHQKLTLTLSVLMTIATCGSAVTIPSAKASLLSTSLNVKTEQFLTQQTPTPTPTPSSAPGDEENAVEPLDSPNETSLEQLVNQDAVEAPLPESEIQQAAEELKNPELVRRLTLPELALRRAKTQLGKTETPPGSNCQPYSRYFGHGCIRWCADFVSWAIDTTDSTHSGHHNKKLPWKNPAQVASILAWGREGHIVEVPKPGDIFILKGGGQSHTGFVDKVEGKHFTTVEGNASNRVKSNRRPLEHAHQFFVRFEKDR